MFSSEATGLEAIAATRALRVPRTITHGTSDTHSFLALEHLELHSHGNAGLLGDSSPHYTAIPLRVSVLHRTTSSAQRRNLTHGRMTG